ncbi:MAG TPA: hypothetical protein VJ967_11540 [Clostridia bacterium]|nr:hypothetical protein [Clostridia bacterium]
MSSETTDFLKRLELENGGTLEWKTYAFLLQQQNSRIITKGGLLYIVGNNLVFEDFASERPINRLIGSSHKTYKKTKLHAALDSVTALQPVARRDAVRVLQGKRSIEQVKSPHKLQRFIDRTVYAIHFADKSVWFCEMYETGNLDSFLPR